MLPRFSGPLIMMEAGLANRSKLIIASLAPVVAIIAAIGLGLLDRFASDGSIDKNAVISSLLVYWFLFFILAGLLPAAARRRNETVLCVVSIAATLIFIEVGCRMFVPSTTALAFDAGGISSSQFHHIYDAHARMYMGRFEGKDVFVETNEDGLRTSYSKEEFRRFENRLIVLGDSLTFGLGVTADDSFAKHVEENLRRTIGNRSVAVLNAGIISYSPFLEKLLFERKLVEYQPTLVLLFLDASDIGDDYLYMKEAEQSRGASTFD